MSFTQNYKIHKKTCLKCQFLLKFVQDLKMIENLVFMVLLSNFLYFKKYKNIIKNCLNIRNDGL